jgi:effector-binding domain-containing protein
MIDTPVILQTKKQLAAVVHLTIPREQISEVMGPGYEEIMNTLRAQGIAPAGPWFTHHLRFEPGIFDFEIGVPVNRPVTPAGRVVPGELPATMVARTVYHGGYDGLANAWPELDRWIASQGKSPDPSLWETYLTGPATNPDPTAWRTELTRPLAG